MTKKQRKKFIEKVFGGTEVMVLIEDMRDDIAAIAESQNDSNRRMDRMEKIAKQTQADVEELKVDMIVVKSDVAVLKSDVSVLKSDVAILKSDVLILKSDVLIVKSDISEIRGNMRGVKKELKIKSDRKNCEKTEKRVLELEKVAA